MTRLVTSAVYFSPLYVYVGAVCWVDARRARRRDES